MEVFAGSFSSSIEQVFQMINITRTRTQPRSSRSMSLGGKQAFLHRYFSLSLLFFSPFKKIIVILAVAKIQLLILWYAIEHLDILDVANFLPYIYELFL